MANGFYKSKSQKNRLWGSPPPPEFLYPPSPDWPIASRIFESRLANQRENSGGGGDSHNLIFLRFGFVKTICHE